MTDLKGEVPRDVRVHSRVEPSDVVGEDGDFVAGTRNGDIAEAGVEEVCVNVGIGVHQNTLGSEPLNTVAGNGIAVIEVAKFGRVEFDTMVVVEAS